MGIIFFFLILFVLFVGGGWYIGRSIGGALERRIYEPENSKPTYVDNSVHHHLHVHEHGPKTVQTHNHLHQNLTVIDDETYQKAKKKFNE